jgi:putative ABC transport system ATP-binding protein
VSEVSGTTSTDDALTVLGLEKWWDEASGLRPISFSMRAGEVVVVRGRSGSGKSTLLAVLAGWCEADGGTFAIAGRSHPDESWATVAVVPQVLALVPELTVRENVAEALSAVPAAPSTDRATTRARVQQVLDDLALDDLADRPPVDTSMGQQQRAAVARAVVGHAVLVLADEPTSHQDPGHVELVVAALVAAAARGSAVLIASHEDVVAAAADRVIDLAV